MTNQSSQATGLLMQILQSSSNDQAARKAAALRKAGIRASRDYMEKLEREVERVEAQAEELLEISSTTDINRALRSATIEEMEDRVTKYHALCQNLQIMKQNLAIAQANHVKLVGSGPETVG